MRPPVPFLVAVVLLASATPNLAPADPTASPSEPSGLVKTVQANPAQRLYKVIFIAIDGQNLAEPRSEIWLKPGVHELEMTALLQREDSLGMRTGRRNRTSKIFTLTVKNQYIYHIGAQMESSDPQTWRPVVDRTERPESD